MNKDNFQRLMAVLYSGKEYLISTTAQVSGCLSFLFLLFYFPTGTEALHSKFKHTNKPAPKYGPLMTVQDGVQKIRRAFFEGNQFYKSVYSQQNWGNINTIQFR